MRSSEDPVPGAKPPKALVFFKTKNNIFNANLNRHKIVNIGLGRFSTCGAQTTASEASRPSACARRSGGVQGADPLAGVARGKRPLVYKKILYFAS